MIIIPVSANVFLKWFKWGESYVDNLKLAYISLEVDKIDQTIGRKPLGAAGEPEPASTTGSQPPELPLWPESEPASTPQLCSLPPLKPPTKWQPQMSPVLEAAGEDPDFVRFFWQP